MKKSLVSSWQGFKERVKVVWFSGEAYFSLFTPRGILEDKLAHLVNLGVLLNLPLKITMWWLLCRGYGLKKWYTLYLLIVWWATSLLHSSRTELQVSEQIFLGLFLAFVLLSLVVIVGFGLCYLIHLGTENCCYFFLSSWTMHIAKYSIIFYNVTRLQEDISGIHWNLCYWRKQMGKLPPIVLQEKVFDVLYMEWKFKGPQRKQK